MFFWDMKLLKQPANPSDWPKKRGNDGPGNRMTPKKFIPSFEYPLINQLP